MNESKKKERERAWGRGRGQREVEGNGRVSEKEGGREKGRVYFVRHVVNVYKHRAVEAIVAGDSYSNLFTSLLFLFSARPG